jgi:hypothetical protein
MEKFLLKNDRPKESFRFLSLIKIAARLRSDVHRNFGEANQDNYKGFDPPPIFFQNRWGFSYPQAKFRL